MKKLFYSFAALAAVVMVAGCAREFSPAEVTGDTVTATFTVTAPGIATKAIADGTSATALTFAAYDGSGNYLEELSGSATVTSAGTKTWTVSAQVVLGMTYKFAFFAKSESDEGFYTFAPGAKTITADYAKLPANNDNADVFYAVTDPIEVSNANLSQSVSLKRPVAQVNVADPDADLTAAEYSLKVADATSTLKLTGINNVLNIFEGTLSCDPEVEFVEFTAAPKPTDKITVGSDEYNRLAMVYVLAGSTSQNTDITITITAKGVGDNADHAITREVSNVPIQANYRTNILGNIFTGTMNFTVTVDNNFESSDTDKLVAPSFSSVSALNAYFETFKDNGDNGDVVPEEVTLAADATVDATTITLPEYDGTVRIKFLPAYSETLTLAYASGDDKPATVEFYASNLTGTLTGELTYSHVTILEGSSIGTVSLQTSDSTLEVRPTAVITTVNIEKGNANIAGVVESVTVPSGATAVDGTSVQVFVAKEAAIKTITLAAKADVVVEQPKNNISSDTDNKVCITISETAEGSTATAQNGGDIYVVANADCTVATDDEDSSAYVAVTSDDVDVTTEGDNIEQTDGPVVARIGVNNYETLAEALAAAGNGDVVTLLANVTYDDGIKFDREGVSAKLNLNSYTLTVNTGSNINNRAIRIDNGTLEVYGGTIVAVGAGTTSSDGTGCYGAFRVEANGVLNAHDLTLQNSRPWGLNVKVVGGQATLENVTINSSYGGGIEVTEANLGEQSQTGQATLTNCNFTQTGFFDHCSTTLSVSGGSHLTVNSGTYTSDNYALYVFSSGGEIEVNGGTFKGNQGDKNLPTIIAMIDLNTYPAYTGGLQLKGGSYEGTFSITSPAYMTVSGGTFDNDPSAYLASGYLAIQDEQENWQVVRGYKYNNSLTNPEKANGAALITAIRASKDSNEPFYISEGTYLMDGDNCRVSGAVSGGNGNFDIRGIGNVVIKGGTLYGLNFNAPEPYVVTAKLSDVTVEGGKRCPIYCRGNVTLDMENVTLKKGSTYTGDNAINIDAGSDKKDGQTITVSCYNVNIEEGMKAEFIACPFNTAGYGDVTSYINFNYDDACNFPENVYRVDSRNTGNGNIKVNGVAVN